MRSLTDDPSISAPTFNDIDQFKHLLTTITRASTESQIYVSRADFSEDKLLMMLEFFDDVDNSTLIKDTNNNVYITSTLQPKIVTSN